MNNQFISLEMIAEIEQAAQNGCLYSQTQLKELTEAQTDKEIAESFEHPIDHWSGLTY